MQVMQYHKKWIFLIVWLLFFSQSKWTHKSFFIFIFKALCTWSRWK